MCSDYNNPYGMSDQEFEYRAMNPQDPMYMGDKYSVPYNTNDISASSYSSKKKSKKSNKSGQNKEPEYEVKVLKDIPEGLFLLIVFLVMGLGIAGFLWLIAD